MPPRQTEHDHPRLNAIEAAASNQIEWLRDLVEQLLQRHDSFVGYLDVRAVEPQLAVLSQWDPGFG